MAEKINSCPKCNSKNVKGTIKDGKIYYTCRNCGNTWIVELSK